MINRKPVWEEIEDLLRLLVNHEISFYEAKNEILKTFLHITEKEKEAIENMYKGNLFWEMEYKNMMKGE